VTVEIYSDVVCPWCYIGKRRFEAGLAMIEDDVEVDFDVSFHPYQLDPRAAPGVATPVFDAYSKKFGSPERATEIIGHVTETAAGEGLEFRMDRAQRANTLLAHRLIWRAAQPGSPVDQDTMKERLLKAYFTDGLNIGDPEVLADCASEIGFDRADAIRFLESDEGSEEVRAELIGAQQNGITAVPTYVLDGQWAIPGAQEAETFAQVLRKIALKAATADADA
jgi:predicted DsbA family dithiol-disulfide isomerase